MSRLPGGDHSPPLLFQSRDPRRRFLGPFLLVIVLHAAVLALTSRMPPPPPAKPPAEPLKLVLRLPPRKVAVDEAPGGGPRRPPPPANRPQARRHLRPPKVIPPPVVEEPPPPLPEPPELAEADEAGDEDDGDGDPDAEPGLGGGGGMGTGIGPGVGPGDGSMTSKARKAWLSHTDWRCRRPGYDEAGRVVVRIRVEVLADGKPGQVRVVKPGPEDFNRRAVDCARVETYLPALDAEGRPIPGDCEFSIEFLN
jgi:hypothetical protein